MTAEPIRPQLQAYLQQSHDNALLPAQYRPAHAPVRQGNYSLPPELLAGLVANQQVMQQQMLALVSQNAEMRATAAASTRMSGRAKDIAVVSAAGGAGVGAATTGIGFMVGMIGANAHGLLVASLAFLAGTGGIAFLKLLFGGPAVFKSVGNHYETHNHINSRGMFSKAIGGSTTNG